MIEGQKAALITMLVSFCLACLKAVVGLASGALVLLTDALDSATDIVTSLVAYLGLRLADRKPDSRFQYGYYKAENLASMLIGAMIVSSAFYFMLRGFQRLFELPAIRYPALTVAAAIVSGAAAYAMYAYLKKVGRRTNSQSLVAAAHDRLKDVFASGIVLVGVFFAIAKVPYGEGIMTMLIAVLVLRMGLLILKDSVFSLMDVSPDRKIEEQVKKILLKNSTSFHMLRLRKAGPFILGEAHLLVNKASNIQRAHQSCELIESQIKKRIPQIASFTIHVEPYVSPSVRLLIPLREDIGLQSRIEPRFARASHYLIVDLAKGAVRSFRSTKNPFTATKLRAGLAASRLAVSERIDAALVQRIGEISFHALRDQLVEVYSAPVSTADAAVKRFVHGKLRLLKKPTNGGT